MSETTTVAIIAVAAIGLVLIYENQQAQQAENQLILAKALQGPQIINTAPASNPLSSLAGIVTAIVGAL